MGTTINSTTALIASKLASAPKTAEVKKNAETARPQHTEAYSSTFSNAARSMAMAGIKQEVEFLGFNDTIEIWAKEKRKMPFMDNEDFSNELQSLMADNY